MMPKSATVPRLPRCHVSRPLYSMNSGTTQGRMTVCHGATFRSCHAATTAERVLHIRSGSGGFALPTHTPTLHPAGHPIATTPLASAVRIECLSGPSRE